MDSNALKKKLALEAIKRLKPNIVLGIGTGKTVGTLIEILQQYKHLIDCCVASSQATEHLLKSKALPVVPLNSAPSIDLYLDSADFYTHEKFLIKGGGGALAREKILAQTSEQFICLVEPSKCLNDFHDVMIPVEVLPMARSFVARELVKLEGTPEYRENYLTDNRNIILDVRFKAITDPLALEHTLNTIPGVLDNGIFANKKPHTIIVADSQKITFI